MNKILMPITQSGPDFVNSNGYIIRGYIDSGKFVVILLILLLMSISFVSQFFSSSRTGGRTRYFNRYKFHFIRIHDNLMYDPSNNKDISIQLR